MSTMRKYGILETSDAYKQLYAIRGGMLEQVGLKFPRTITQLVKFAMLSPGDMTLWHDIEAGWMVEVREYPGSPPIYHSIGDKAATDILKGKHLHEYHAQYLVPDSGIDH